jgi:hypothetical protein
MAKGGFMLDTSTVTSLAVLFAVLISAAELASGKLLPFRRPIRPPMKPPNNLPNAA